MLPRISRIQYCLGVLLLLSQALESSAFTHHAPLPSRLPLGAQQIWASGRNRIAWQANLSMETQKISLGVAGDLREVSTKTGSGSSSLLTWLLASYRLAQSRMNQATTSSPDTKAAGYSIILSTLFRSDRLFTWTSLQQVLTFGVLTWQLVFNMGHLMRWANAAGSAFGAWYMGCLAAFPVYTKSLTTGVIGLVGDTMAQIVEEGMRSRNQGTAFQLRQRYDRRRGVANTLDGVLVMGPLLHYAYNYLEWLIPVSGAATGMAATVAAMSQVFIDDFILDAIFVGIMFFTTGLGEGYSLRNIWNQFRNDYTGAVRTSWATSVLLMPVEFILFRFFPLRVRVLGMNLIDIVWEGMMSYLVHRRRNVGDSNEHVQDMRNTLERERSPVLVPAR